MVGPKIWARPAKEVNAMTALRELQTAEVTHMPRRTRITEWTLGTVGVLAAAIGAWMYFVPTDWFLGGLAEAWYFGFLIGSGALIALAAGIFARQMYRVDHAWTARVVVATVVTVLAIAAAVVFATILII
jgi:hypothetical protein